MPDHVHIMIVIPPNYAVAQVVGFIKGKSAIHPRGTSGRGAATLWGITSGRGGTLRPQWGATNRRSDGTSDAKRWRIRGKIS